MEYRKGRGLTDERHVGCANTSCSVKEGLSLLMPDSSDPTITANRITLYDSVRIPAGETMPKQITFSFGADADDFVEERLFELAESEIIDRVLESPELARRLLSLLGLPYPECWIITALLTKEASRSWPHDKPGDLDIVGGRMQDGKPVLEYIACAQVKIRKVRDMDDTGSFSSGAGTTQAHFTARMGFDRTLLLHCIVREPQPLPEGYSPSWNSILNADFERAAKGCCGTIKRRFEQDRELYGFAWIGWGQAFGKRFNTCGGLCVDLVYPPPFRPALDSSESAETRVEVAETVKRILFDEHAGGSLPLIVPCGRWRRG